MTATRRRPQLVAAAALTLTLSALGGAPALADDTAAPATGEPLTLEDVGGPPGTSDLTRATDRYNEKGTLHYELDRTISAVSTVTTEGAKVKVTLASDILFDVESSDLSGAAKTRLAAVVHDVPRGAGLAIAGHTDSVASTAHNQTLSQHRADAVAKVLRGARPDLKLTVRGYGETRPKVVEAGDDIAEDRAQNRRVELTYTKAGRSKTTTTEVAPSPVEAAYQPGQPAVHPVDQADAVVTKDVEVPDDGARVRVAVERLTVRGPVVRLRVQLTPLDVVGDGGRPASVFGMTGEGDLRPLLVDRTNLTSYSPALAMRVLPWASDVVDAKTAVDGTVRYEVSFARPVTHVAKLDVSLVPTWPTFAGIPVDWD